MVQDAFVSDPTGAIAAARKRVNGGDLDGAVKELVRYVSSHPKEIEPARYLADLYYRQSDFSAAERTLLAILKIVPNDPDTLNRLGGIYAAQDRLPEAIDAFQRSLPNSMATSHLVELHRRKGDLPAYELEKKREAEQHPSDWFAQFSLGQIYVAERRPIEGVLFLQRALEIQPRHCPVLSELGSAYIDLDRLPLAVSTLQACLNFNPDEYSALVNIGDAYIVQRQLGKAREALEHANRVRPDGFEALVDLGYIEDLGMRWQSAVQFYLRAIAVDPLARDAYVNLGYDYVEHRLFTLAEAAFLKGLSVSPNDGRLHYLLGVTYAEQNKKALAKNEYELAVRSDEPEVARAATRDLALLKSVSYEERVFTYAR